MNVIKYLLNLYTFIFHNILKKASEYTLSQYQKNIKLLLGIIIMLLQCTHLEGQKNTIHPVEYECLCENIADEIALNVYLNELEIVKKIDVQVTPEEEKSVSDSLLKQLEKENLIEEHPDENDYKKIHQVLNNLLKVLPNKRSNKYVVYILKSQHINAFNLGNKIFITLGCLSAIKNEHELAMVLAHEIGHNELRHTYYDLKRIKYAGDLGEILLMGKKTFIPSLNQFQELEADCYALDVIKMAGYDPRLGILFFDTFKKEKENNEESNEYLEKIFSSHPLYNYRKKCLIQFIEKYHNN